MKLETKQFGCALAFLAWVLPRIIPLLLYPGAYSFDSWTHMGYVEAILTNNHIPSLDPLAYPYVSTPFLHLFLVAVHQFFGLSLVDSFRLCACILVILGFLSFYIGFRSLLGNGWPAIAAMLLFSLDIDVLYQTNCVIPENFALSYLALIIAVSVNSIKEERSRAQWLLMLALMLPTLALGHQLTSLFGLYFALAFLLASVTNRNVITRRFGILSSLVWFCSLLGLLILSSPFMVVVFLRYSFILATGLCAVVLLSVILHLGREKFWHILGQLKHSKARWLFPILGGVSGMVFFSVALIFYPYGRDLSWVVFKFGLISCMLGLSVAVVHLMLWADDKSSILGVFIVVSALIVGLSFTYATMRQFLDLAIGRFSLEVSFGHRHLAFLVIPFVVMSTVAIYKLEKSSCRGRLLPCSPILATVLTLLVVFSIGGVYNVYAPIGGWYPEWCDNSEINSGMWLRVHSSGQFAIITDVRLGRMMEGMFPIGTNRFRFVQLEPSLLSELQTSEGISLPNYEMVYFMTSSLMEERFISEALTPPTRLEVSAMLNQVNSVAKIQARLNANIYSLAT